MMKNEDSMGIHRHNNAKKATTTTTTNEKQIHLLDERLTDSASILL